MGNTAKQCTLGLFQDSDYQVEYIVHFWRSVSHSSTEAEIISLDAGLRTDGIPAFDLWDKSDWSVALLLKPTSTEKLVVRQRAKETQQHQNEDAPQPKWSWIIKFGLHHHKSKFFLRRVSVVHLWRQWSGSQDDCQRQKSDNETRVPNPQSCAGLVVWQNQLGSKSNTLIRPIHTREPNCLHDLWAFAWNRSLWSGTRIPRLVQCAFTEWWCPRFRRTMGPSSIISKWNSCRECPGRFVQVKITGIRSASHCIGYVWPRKTLEITNHQTSPDWRQWYDGILSDNEDTQLQSLERKNWKKVVTSSQEGEESAWRGKWESAISGKQLDNVRKETHAVSVTMEHLENRCGHRQKRTTVFSFTKKAQTQTDGKKPSKGSGLRGGTPSGTGGRSACRNVLVWKCTNPSCIIGTLPCV